MLYPKSTFGVNVIYQHRVLWVTMTIYSRFGKILIPLSPQEFEKGLLEGHFCQDKHRAFAALLYHTGIRVSEALRATKEQFSMQKEAVYFDVLKRLKGGRHTPPLKIPLEKPGALEIWESVSATETGKRVFPYCRKTGFNIVARVWKYPHHFRLTRITELAKRFSIAQLVNWTGLNPMTLNFYIGLVDIEEMGEV